MPGRHDSQPLLQRRWAPTALDAVVSVTPATSLFAALGLAGGGFLVGREGVAACGAVVGAVGLVVERFQSRTVRLKLRRERVRHRDDLLGVSFQLHELRRELSGLRDDLAVVRVERDAVRGELRATMAELSQARTFALGARSSGPVAPDVVAEPLPDVVAEPLPDVAAEPLPAVARSPFVVLLPGQLRSPIATGGLPVLEPGPSMPVLNVIDLRTRSGSVAEPANAMAPELADALVYASMAEADAHRLAESLESPGLHTGDAHHAGDYARGEASATPSGPATLYVVKRGRHVA